jgi:hypothetical protein
MLYIYFNIDTVSDSKDHIKKIKKANISLYQVVEAHRVARSRGFHIF